MRAVPHSVRAPRRLARGSTRYFAACLLTVLSGSTSRASDKPQPPQLVLQIGHSQSANSASFSPNGRWVATASWDGTVRIWEVAGGYEFRVLKTDDPQGATDVSFSYDGSLVAACGPTAGVTVWQAATGTRVFSLKPGKPGQRCHLSFSPAEPYLAALTDANKLSLWNTANWQKVWDRAPDPIVVRSLAFTPDSRLIFAVGDDKLAILDASTGQSSPRFHGQSDMEKSSFSSIAVSPDGKILAATGRVIGEIEFFSVETQKQISVVKEAGPVSNLHFSADGSRIISACSDNTIRMWKVATGELDTTIKPQSYVDDAALSPNGRTVVSVGRQVSEWDAGTKKLSKVFGADAAPIDSIAISRDAQSLAFAGWGALRMLDLASSELHTRSPAVTNAVALSPDGHWIAMGTSRYQPPFIAVCERVEKPQPCFILSGHTDIIQALAFSTDGKWLVSASEDETVRIWDLSARKEVSVLKEHTNAVLGLAIVSDLIVSASADGTLKVWGLPSGDLRKTLTGHRHEVHSVAGSLDGRFLVSGDSDGVLKCWDVETGTESWSRLAHHGSINAVTISDDGKIASGGDDHAIKVWDSTDGNQLSSLSAHTDIVRSLMFVPKSDLLVSGGDDGSARIWDAVRGRELGLITTTKDTEDWAVVTPEGLFDGSENGVKNLVAWRIGTHVYPPDKFYVDYYTPGLLTKIFSGERPTPKLDIASLKLPPELKIDSVASNAANPGHATVTIEAHDQGGGVSVVRLYQNGKLIAAHRVTRGNTLSKLTYTFDVGLVPGENSFRGVALSDENVESNDDTAVLSNTSAKAAASTLHVLTVGINRYKDPSLELHYARQDGESIASFFKAHYEKLFASIDVTALFDEQATQANIRAALEKLTKSAKPEDVLLVYLAGHGVGLNEQFYFLPYEVQFGNDDEDTVRTYGISASTIGDYLRQIPALKQLLVLDACQSEAALPILAKMATFRSVGSPERKATQMLARANGIYLIAASTKKQYAVEVPELHHGVLTYALLSGLGEDGKPQAASGSDGMVTVLGLVQYVNTEVPDITEKYRHVKQFPVSFNAGMDFPLLVR